MTIETLKSPNPRNRKGISVIKSKFLSVSSMNTFARIFFGFVANSIDRILLKRRQSVFPLFVGFVCSVTVVFCC